LDAELFDYVVGLDLEGFLGSLGASFKLSNEGVKLGASAFIVGLGLGIDIGGLDFSNNN
jgi:hypothetical protein